MGFDPWLRQLLKDIFESADEVWDMSIADLAYNAGLHYQTVLRIRNKQTKEPKMRTVYKLCKAVGMDMRIVQESRRKKVA